MRQIEIRQRRFSRSLLSFCWQVGGRFLVLAVLFPSFVLSYLIFSSPVQAQAYSGTTYYVSKNGSNTTGLSWSGAWNELSQIAWSRIHPGDTILLDGGASSMTYTTTLTIGESGTQGHPITIARSAEPGHNGTITLFGGNTIPLPYCGQKSWTPPSGTVGDAIDMSGQSWITIDGLTWGGIQVHGFTYKTINFSGGENNDMLSNLEVHDNGNGLQSGGVWYSEFPGIGFYGNSGSVSNLTFNYMNVHDNGEDNFQGDLSVNNLTIANSWMHYTRTFPGVPSESYNLCTHNDGLQLFGSNSGSGLTFQNDIFGPGLTNGFITQPEEDNVTIENSLFLDPGSNVTVENNAANGWKIDHVTAFAQDDNLTLEGGSGHSVSNSVFVGGNILLSGSSFSASNNCEWNAREGGGTLNAKVANPQFHTGVTSYTSHTNDITQYPALAFLQTADFSLQSGSPCAGRGAAIASIPRFLQSVAHAGAVVAPKATPTATPKPTSTALASAGTSEGSEDHHLAPTPSASPGAISPLWLIAGGLVLVAIVALLALLFFRRMRRLSRIRGEP